MSQENAQTLRGARYSVSLPGERASQRRTLDERLYVRFPALYRLIADRVMRLPPGSRLRRLILARLAGRGLAALNRRDFEVGFLGFDPGIEYHPAIGQRLPDMDAVVYGHDAYEAVWRHMIDSFEDFHAEPEEVLDLGDVLLGAVRYAGHGSGSGVPADVRLFQVFRLQRGLVVWQRDFTDRAEALEAATQGE